MFKLCKKQDPKPLTEEADYLQARRERAVAELGRHHVLHPDYDPAANPHHHLRCINNPKRIEVVMGRRV